MDQDCAIRVVNIQVIWTRATHLIVSFSPSKRSSCENCSRQCLEKTGTLAQERHLSLQYTFSDSRKVSNRCETEVFKIVFDCEAIAARFEIIVAGIVIVTGKYVAIRVLVAEHRVQQFGVSSPGAPSEVTCSKKPVSISWSDALRLSRTSVASFPIRAAAGRTDLQHCSSRRRVGFRYSHHCHA